MRLPFIFDPTRVAIALGIAAVVVTILYLLKERYRPIVVSYLPLWEQSVRKSTPLALARRLRKLLSLLLQMAIVALTVWALTDPAWRESREPRNTVILIDVSPSMSAHDGAQGLTRIEQAIAFAGKIERAAAEDDSILLVGLSTTPVVVRAWSSADPAWRSALEEVEVTEGQADIAQGLRFARAALTGRDGGEIWILSDGAFNLEESRARDVEDVLTNLEKSGITVNHHRCGRQDDNAAIIRFALRQDLRDRMRFVGQLEVARFSQGGHNAPLPVRLEVRSGGHPVLTRKLELSSESEKIWLDLLSPPSREIEAEIEPEVEGRDHLEADNRATVTLPEETALKILAISRGNTYLQAALLLSPSWEAEWIGPDASPSLDEYDVVILDGDASLPDVETRGILAIHPTGEKAIFESDGVIEMPSFDTFDREHPITRWTNLYNVNIGSALNLVTEKDDRIIGRSKEGPLMVLREPEEGPRLIALAFELSASDLPMRAAWPLLFLNTINYLGGENLEVASSRASPRESRIAPTWIRGTKHHGSPPASSPRRPPLWLVIVLGVTLLFAMEWFTYHKRITV
ncbi:MAG: VWA domain-containing protein [Deltaproteobacteria bacterium]|nr:VWA domain-containing protein [Deltaproteobacteria bacterium]